MPPSQFAQLLVKSPQTTKPVSIPAPNGGVNRVDGLAAMPDKDAIFLYNMVPSEYGTKVRTGYQEFATNVGGASGNTRTLIAFTGSTSSDNKLFAAADDAIYDISSGGSTPTSKLTFGTSDSTSGIGVSVNFVNDAAAYFCLYTDETNGYHVYTQATDTWAAVTMGAGATQISGVDPADLVFVTIFKNRVWFVQRDSGLAWYLAAGSIYGAATSFNFGNKFKYGGHLVGLYSWTVDGGAGVDDYLVAISSGGDVVVYKGSDPATATDWFLHGAWYSGPPPAGRRIAGSFSGELYILSSYGILPMTRLLSGTMVELNEVYLSKKITPLINSAMLSSRSTRGWEIRLVPGENLLLVSSPKETGYDYVQFAYSLNTPGWGVFRELPYYTGTDWGGSFYFTDETDAVYKLTGDQDGVDLTGANGVDIEWSGLMSFQGYGNDATNKRVHFIRPVFLSGGTVDYSTEARYDYDLDEVFGSLSTSPSTTSEWDSALWDSAVWGEEFGVIQSTQGARGLGRVVAVGFSGRSRSRTILLKIDLMLDSGGLL